MADIASLAVGLHLNAANFKAQLMTAYKTADTQSQRLGKSTRAEAKKSEEAYARLGRSITSVATRMASLAGVSLSLGAAITASRDYSKSLAALAASAKLTRHEIGMMEKQAEALSRELKGFSTTAVIQSFNDIIAMRPGILNVAGDLDQVTRSSITLAQAAGAELPQATNALTSALNAFNGTAAESDRYINALAAGLQQGPASLDEMTRAIRSSGEAASWSSVSIEQMVSTLQTMARQGISAGEGASALRNVLLTLEKQTNSNLRPSVVGLDTALNNLAKQNLSAAQASKLFGVRNQAVMGILLKYRNEISETSQAITGTTAAFDQAGERTNNLDGDLKNLSSTITSVLSKIGGSSSGSLRAGVQSVTDAVQYLGDNFNTIADIATYTLMPVIAGRMTLGLQSNTYAWIKNTNETRKAAKQQLETARVALAAGQAEQQSLEIRGRKLTSLYNHYAGSTLGMKNYNAQRVTLWRLEEEAIKKTELATHRLNAAQKKLSVTSLALSGSANILKGALSMLGGPLGVALIAGTAIYQFATSSHEATQKALSLKDAVVETTEALMQLSKVQLSAKIVDYQSELKDQLKEQKSIQKRIANIDDELLSYAKHLGLDEYSGPAGKKKKLEAEFEDITEGVNRLKQNLENTKNALVLVSSGVKLPAKEQPAQKTAPTSAPFTAENVDEKAGRSGKKMLDQFKQLRQEIETANAGSLQRLYLQEREAQAKLLIAARESGASLSDVKNLSVQIEESYQKQRLQLAETYSPKAAIEREERETSALLKELYKDRLLDQESYQQAQLRTAQNAARERMQANAEAVALPKIDMAGDVDPIIQLQNQLEQQKALYQQYYINGKIDKDRFEQLMQSATTESADAQYQAALKLYTGQSKFHGLAVNLFSVTEERLGNMLTSVTMGTGSFTEGIKNMAASMAQSIIQTLMQIAMQAIITRSILQPLGLAQAAAAMPMAQSFPLAPYPKLNAKGNVYDSPSLSHYSNQIVNKPTMFAFARGAGIMGEAGPEAIMPLTRGRDGSLGVRATGGSNVSQDIKVTVNISSDEKTEVDAQGAGNMGQLLGDEISRVCMRVLNREITQGGIIDNRLKSRS